MAQFAHFTIGQNETFKVLAKLPQSNATSTPLDITDYTFTGKVRENYTTTEVAAEFTINKIEPYSSGAIVLELENSKTKNLSLRKYVYDIMAESGSFKRKILEGYINVRRQVTPFVFLIPETREYKADFQVSTFLNNTSLDLRPDAISFDYKTAFTFGPTNINDVSQGFLNKVWKIRADNDNNVWYASSTGNEWTEETLLFSYTGLPIEEIDCTFEQTGRLVITAQRNTGTNDTSEVWLYWFDPLLGDFTFVNLGPGRTPRIGLDNIFNLANSDVLLFYANDLDNKISYRVQRDRYAIEYDLPNSTSENVYLEKAQLGQGRRFRLTYLTRNPTTGKYGLAQRTSKLVEPNFTVDTDFMTATGSFVSMNIRQILITASMETEYMYSTGSFVSMQIRQILVTSSMDTEFMYSTASLVSMSVQQTLITSSVSENYYVTGSVNNLAFQDILIVQSPLENYQVTGSVASVTIAVP